MHQAPNTASGEATITIGGIAYPIRFGLNVMRDFTKLTGTAPSEFGTLLGEDYPLALAGILCCAVQRYVPADKLPNDFGLEQAADLCDDLSAVEAESIAEAITEAVTVGNPLLAALSAKVAAKNKATQLAQPSA